MSNTQSANQTEALFEIYLNDASMINEIISEICNPDDNSTFIITSEGLRLIVNGDKISQVSAFFAAGTFDRFEFKAGDEIRYKFSLKDFIEILNLLRDEPAEGDQASTKTSLEIQYHRRGGPLKMHLKNGTNYSIGCDLREFSALTDNSLMAFESYEEPAEIYFHSKELYKYISGLDMTSSVFLKITWNKNPDRADKVLVKMVTESPTMGEVELDIRPDNQQDMREPILRSDLVMPDNEIYRFCYRCKFVAPAFEALKTSKTVRMKCGQSGLLLMEHFYGREPRVQSVQYYVLREAAQG